MMEKEVIIKHIIRTPVTDSALTKGRSITQLVFAYMYSSSVYIKYPGLDVSGSVFCICPTVDRSGNRAPSVIKMTKLTYHATLISGNLAKGASDVFLCFPKARIASDVILH